jgi:transcriptional regulator with XRE-family HTH domain
MPAKKPIRAPERGHRIAEARKRRGLTQQDLAEKVGVHRVSIARLEAGARSPSMALARRIAGVLDTDIATLFGGGR